MAPPNRSVVLSMVVVFAIASLFHLAGANDPDPLQDIAVADLDAELQPNGYLAKPSSEATIDDFITSALSKAANTSDRKTKAVVTPAFAPQFPGLNTQGVGMSRIDFGPRGLNPPHIHPRASEILYLVTGGPLEVGFVTSTTDPATNNPPSRLINGTLYEGQAVVFPRGLLHFQRNIGQEQSYAIAGFNSQNPGVEVAGDILFGSSPYPISSEILELALGVDAETLDKLIAYAQKP